MKTPSKIEAAGIKAFQCSEPTTSPTQPKQRYCSAMIKDRYNMLLMKHNTLVMWMERRAFTCVPLFGGLWTMKGRRTDRMPNNYICERSKQRCACFMKGHERFCPDIVLRRVVGRFTWSERRQILKRSAKNLC